MNDMYRVDVWQNQKIIDSLTTNLVDKINEWIITNGYKNLWDDGGCAIYVYKKKLLNINEQDNKGIKWYKD